MPRPVHRPSSDRVAPALIEIRLDAVCAGCGGPMVVRRSCGKPDTAFLLRASDQGYSGEDVGVCRRCFENDARMRVVVSEAKRFGGWRRDWSLRGA